MRWTTWFRLLRSILDSHHWDELPYLDYWDELLDWTRFWDELLDLDYWDESTSLILDSHYWDELVLVWTNWFRLLRRTTWF